MARAGKETTLKECDANIAINYSILKKHGKAMHHEDEMNKSLDRRLVLMNPYYAK